MTTTTTMIMMMVSWWMHSARDLIPCSVFYTMESSSKSRSPLTAAKAGNGTRARLSRRNWGWK